MCSWFIVGVALLTCSTTSATHFFISLTTTRSTNHKIVQSATSFRLFLTLILILLLFAVGRCHLSPCQTHLDKISLFFLIRPLLWNKIRCHPACMFSCQQHAVLFASLLNISVLPNKNYCNRLILVTFTEFVYTNVFICLSYSADIWPLGWWHWQWRLNGWLWNGLILKGVITLLRFKAFSELVRIFRIYRRKRWRTIGASNILWVFCFLKQILCQFPTSVTWFHNVYTKHRGALNEKKKGL